MTEEESNTNTTEDVSPFMPPDPTITDDEWEIQQAHMQRPQYCAYTPEGWFCHNILVLKVMRMTSREAILQEAGWHYNERVFALQLYVERI